MLQWYYLFLRMHCLPGKKIYLMYYPLIEIYLLVWLRYWIANITANIIVNNCLNDVLDGSDGL